MRSIAMYIENRNTLSHYQIYKICISVKLFYYIILSPNVKYFNIKTIKIKLIQQILLMLKLS